MSKGKKLIAYVGRNHVANFEGGGVSVFEVSADGSSITPLPAVWRICRRGQGISPMHQKRKSSIRLTKGKPMDEDLKTGLVRIIV